MMAEDAKCGTCGLGAFNEPPRSRSISRGYLHKDSLVALRPLLTISFTLHPLIIRVLSTSSRGSPALDAALVRQAD
jgi:hypothetical protein